MMSITAIILICGSGFVLLAIVAAVVFVILNERKQESGPLK